MKLSKLHLQGFKSFGNPTQFAFDDGVTAIIGPNGCGKSNVVDAFKWVLGGRSTKSLRAEEMLDVIFNGSAGMKSADYAEVALTFANNTRDLPIDYDEVTVCRRLYRSGESEYILNNQACRLKDIRELFMNTGVGMESYSIIEQGKVDFILRSNPKERRSLFEEAAGISKYKAKRKETESNLEKVGQDLIRLADVLREIKRQIRSIKLAATRAEKYKLIQAQYREKKNLLNLRQYHQWQSGRTEISGKMAVLEAQRQEMTAQLAGLEAEIIQFDKELINLDNELRVNQDKLVDLGAEIATASHKIESSTQRREELLVEEEQTKQSLAANTEKGLASRNKLVEMMHQLEITQNELETISNNIGDKQNVFSQIEAETAQAVQSLEAKKSEIIGHNQKQLQYQNELSGLQNELRILTGKREHLVSRKKAIAEEREFIAKQQELLSVEAGQVLQSINSVKSEIGQQEVILNSFKSDLAQIQDEISRKSAELHRTQSRQEILMDLELHNEGISGGARSVLAKIKSEPNSLGIVYGIVADMIDVKEEYLIAVESALKELSQAIVVHSFADALNILQYVRDNNQGNVTIIALDEISTQTSQSVEGVALPSALSMINPIGTSPLSTEDFARLQKCLLGDYCVVEDVAVARQLANNGRSALTLKGDVFRPNGVTSAGETASGLGLISRKTELRHLAEQIPQIQESLKLLQEQQVNKLSELEKIEATLQKQRISVYELNVALDNKGKEVDGLNGRAAILAKESEIVELESQDAEAQINSVAERATVTAQVIKDIEVMITAANAESEELTRMIKLHQDRKHAVEAEISDLKVARATAAEKKEFCARTVEQLNSDIQQADLLLQSIADSLAEIRNKITAIGEAIVTEQATLSAKETERQNVQQVIQNLTEQETGLKTSLQARKTRENELQRDMQNLNTDYNGLTLQEREYALKLENLVEKAREETAGDLKADYDTATEETKAAFSAIVPEEVARQIEELRRGLDSMSAEGVSLSAIDELKSLEERLQFMTTQEQDLVKSKESLRELIRKINRECREKFEQTFNLIQENFSQIFRKLFGGGKAELILIREEEAPKPEGQSANGEAPAAETPAAGAVDASAPAHTPGNDILEAGIDIMAKPPGKEPSSISLLSGGEKALTALALVMAIFKLQPSPFCILDEADAPLDEHNTDRFAGLIKEFASTSQFIVITHNKKTMMAADALYGVTMSIPGVSKKISVKMIDEVKAIYKDAPIPSNPGNN
ncbi:MAG: chromosome segregation protein SMC [Candidatus Brocadiia bacterium]